MNLLYYIGRCRSSCRYTDRTALQREQAKHCGFINITAVLRKYYGAVFLTYLCQLCGVAGIFPPTVTMSAERRASSSVSFCLSAVALHIVSKIVIFV